METVKLKIKGMSCTNCAYLLINLEKEKLKNISVNFIGGDASFDDEAHVSKEKIEKGIERLGYKITSKKHTISTIKQNLFRAFLCNVVAIPVAALGFLHLHSVH